MVCLGAVLAVVGPIGVLGAARGANEKMGLVFALLGFAAVALGRILQAEHHAKMK